VQIFGHLAFTQHKTTLQFKLGEIHLASTSGHKSTCKIAIRSSLITPEAVGFVTITTKMKF
jgi:ribosomal protein S19